MKQGIRDIKHLANNSLVSSNDPKKILEHFTFRHFSWDPVALFSSKDIVAILQEIIKTRSNFQGVAKFCLQSTESAFVQYLQSKQLTNKVFIQSLQTFKILLRTNTHNIFKSKGHL